VLVILASQFDEPARRLRDRWAGSSSRILTCEDLSRSGWRYRVDDPENSVAVIQGDLIPQSQIFGVLTRLAWVSEMDVRQVAREDRTYVASEMAAFLLCWLFNLKCPILNQPSANCLTGPGWLPEQWNLAAAQAGMRVAETKRHVVLNSSNQSPDPDIRDPKGAAATVLNGRCFGDVDRKLFDQAVCLSRMVNMDFLSVKFTGPDADATFEGVNIFPDVDDPQISDALLTYFLDPEPLSNNLARAAARG
jgi:hypothetical protein